jgi:hypothetical protein
MPKPGTDVLRCHARAISRSLGVGSSGSRRGRALPGLSANFTVIDSPARSVAMPDSSALDAAAALSAESTLGVGTNSRSANVAVSLGSAGLALTRKLGITPVKIDSTDERATDGTHRKCSMRPWLATTSATSSVVCGSPDRPSRAAKARSGSRPAGNRKPRRTRPARIASSRRCSCSQIPPSMAEPPVAATTAGTSSVFIASAPGAWLWPLPQPPGVHARPAWPEANKQERAAPCQSRSF